MELVFVVARADFFGGDWPQGFVPLADGDRMLAEFARRGFFVPRAEAEQQPAWKQLIPYCVLRRGDSVLCVQRKTAQTENRLHGMWSIGLGGHVNPLPTPTAAAGWGVPGAAASDPGSAVDCGAEDAAASGSPAASPAGQPVGARAGDGAKDGAGGGAEGGAGGKASGAGGKAEAGAAGGGGAGGGPGAGTVAGVEAEGEVEVAAASRRGRWAAPEPSFLAALRQELEEELHHALGAGPEPRFLGLLNDDDTPVGQVHAGLVYRLDCRADPGAAVPSVREISKMHGCFRSLAELAHLWQDPARFESWSRILMQAGVAGAMAVTELSADRDPQGTTGSKESNHGRTQCDASDA